MSAETSTGDAPLSPEQAAQKELPLDDKHDVKREIAWYKNRDENFFREAYERGAEACRAHYRRVDAGEIGEMDCRPENPYPAPERWNPREKSPHELWNRGWNNALEVPGE